MMTRSAESTHQPQPLSKRCLVAADSPTAAYANKLLASLGAITPATSLDPVAAQAAWARSGAMMLTGLPDGPPLACPAPLAACLQGACEALQVLAPTPFVFDAVPLLGERAAIAGHRRLGAISPGGACRLLATADGHIALNLARDDDWSLLPALLDGREARDWQTLASALRHCRTAGLCDKARLLGLAATSIEGEPCERNWYEIIATGPQRAVRNGSPLVIDLSSLWAGPVCSHLLQLAGARVIKVESLSRPDGARRGPADFFDLLNAGKQSIALDLNTPTGIAQLRGLLQAADIVIESSRPRALQQMGIYAEQLIAEREGLTWISITGYGREPEQAMRIAYGDDAGVAAGLSAQLLRQYGIAAICGDAIADPLTGAHAALAALACWSSGGGYLMDVALQPVVNHCMRIAALPCGEVRQDGDEWILRIDQREFPVLPPSARAVTAHAAELGADTNAICREFALPC
jgi:hypothetical protein